MYPRATFSAISSAARAEVPPVQRSTAPLIVTPLFRTFAAPDAGVYLPGAPFLMTALLLLLSALVFWPLRPGRQQAPAA